MVTVTNNEQVIVNASPTDVWDQYIQPSELDSILPNVSSVNKRSERVYDARISLGVFGLSEIKRVRITVPKEDRPNNIILESDTFDSRLDIQLSEYNSGTRLYVSASFDLTLALRPFKPRIESELSTRMYDALDGIRQRYE